MIRNLPNNSALTVTSTLNDAFGTAHRAHASTAGVTEHLDPCAMGFLIEKELKFLVEKLEKPGPALRRDHGRCQSFRQDRSAHSPDE